MNAKMPELQRAFEAGGFTNVKTILGTGNVVFDARAASAASLAKKCEAAMTKELGKSFLTFIRSIDDVRALLAADPFQRFRLAAGAKRVVTFLRAPPAPGALGALPIELDGVKILCVKGNEIFTAYVPNPQAGGAFMRLIEKTFSKEVTTRTWDTVKKIAK